MFSIWVFIFNHIFTGSKDEMFAMYAWGRIAKGGHQDDGHKQGSNDETLAMYDWSLIAEGCHQDDGHIEEEQQLWQLWLRFILFVKRAVFRKYTVIWQIHTRLWKIVLYWPKFELTYL